MPSKRLFQNRDGGITERVGDVGFYGFVSALALASFGGLSGCDSSEPPALADAGEPASDSGEPQRIWSHTFPPITIEPGQEISNVCQSWTLGNPESLYVRRVRTTNEGGWHHSNWLYVRDVYFQGEDGTWACPDRDFNEASGGLQGNVFFAQSTQAVAEEQIFPPGAALRMPPRARVIGSVHLINTTRTTLETPLSFEVETIPEEEVTTILSGMAITITHLALPARAKSRFTIRCDFDEAIRTATGAAPNFQIYYVLPHYHGLGTGSKLTLGGGDREGDVIFETSLAIGDPLGQTVDPPIPVTGATAVEFSCDYDNPRDEVVRYGIGDQEMCVFLAFTNAGARIVALSNETRAAGMDGDVHLFESECMLFAIRD
jgi:hypothetical protein